MLVRTDLWNVQHFQHWPNLLPISTHTMLWPNNIWYYSLQTKNKYHHSPTLTHPQNVCRVSQFFPELFHHHIPSHMTCPRLCRLISVDVLIDQRCSVCFLCAPGNPFWRARRIFLDILLWSKLTLQRPRRALVSFFIDGSNRVSTKFPPQCVHTTYGVP